MNGDPAYELTKTVMRTADTFLRESQRLFRPYGLTGAQYNVLNILSGYPGGISQRELGDMLVVDRSNVTGLLDRLEKAGWVRRDDDPHDRRVYRVSLTASGHAQWKKIHPLYLEAVRQIAAGLSDREIRACDKALHELERGAAAWKLSQ